ncbi:unnamed protein product [Allacma fusca]|uniref:Uncharacterized protein n=1 Tax=Allacma fusca TaxID=39272 RepID=A0A8J2JMN5_9HEXA|nr:unnamed protein product [Allacma fusca]
MTRALEPFKEPVEEFAPDLPLPGSQHSYELEFYYSGAGLKSDNGSILQHVKLAVRFVTSSMLKRRIHYCPRISTSSSSS